MNYNPIRPTKPETRYPLDDITSNGFIYDALRVSVGIAIIVLLTYLACNSDISWISYVWEISAFISGYLLAMLRHTRLIQRIKDTRHYMKRRGYSLRTAWELTERAL